MKILVTGGAGFIGSYVIEELVKRKYEVFGADRSLLWKMPGATYHELDVTNQIRTDQLIEGIKPNLIIHLAGILGTSETWSHVRETTDSNILGAINVFEAAGKNKIDILTVDVGSRWLVPYTISKRCAAEFAFAYGNKYKVKAGVLRIFNVYGPRQGTKIIKIIPKFIEQALKNVNLEVWGDKNADLIYAKDVAVAFANAVENIDKIDQVQDLLIGSGDQISVLGVAKTIVSKIGTGKVVQMSHRIGEEKTNAGFMESKLAAELLNWQPSIKLNAGLEETILYYRKYFGYA